MLGLARALTQRKDEWRFALTLSLRPVKRSVTKKVQSYPGSSECRKLILIVN